MEGSARKTWCDSSARVHDGQVCSVRCGRASAAENSSGLNNFPDRQSVTRSECAWGVGRPAPVTLRHSTTYLWNAPVR
jgi:hypothetical protein